MAIESSRFIELLEGRQLLSTSFANAQDVEIAYDASGTLHMAYYDAAEKVLKYATRTTDGAWSAPVTVDAAGGDVGRQLSLAIDRQNRPGIAYRDAAARDLKHAHLDQPGWVIARVATRGNSGRFPSLAYNAANRPVISYYRGWDQSIAVATLKPSGWRERQIRQVSSSASMTSSIAVNPATGRWGVAYERADASLWLARVTPQGQILHRQIASLPGGGGVPSLAYNASGQANISFYDKAGGRIMLAQRSDATWTSAAVATVGQIGGESRLLLNSATGAVELAYHQPSLGGLALASFVSGQWQASRVSSGVEGGIAVAREPGNGLVVGLWVSDGSANVGFRMSSVEDLAAVASGGGVNLSWTDSTSATHSHGIERSTDGTSFTPLATVAANTQSYSDTSALEGVTYHYRVWTATPSGNRVLSAARQAALPLRAPADVSVAALGDVEMRLQWRDVSTVESGYRVERSTDGASYQVIANRPTGSTAYTDTGLEEGHRYYYRVTTVAATGTALSSAVNAYTLPATPTDLAASLVSSWQVDLAWTDNSQTEDGYVVRVSKDGINWTVLDDTLPANSTSYSVLGDADLSPLDDATTYRFSVKARRGADRSTASGTAQTTIPLAAPIVSAPERGGGSITIRWSDVSVSESGYRVYRSSDGVDFSQIAELEADASQYADAGLAEGTVYHYRVQAYTGEETADSEVITTNTLLRQPTEFSGALVSASEASFTWTDNSDAETGYRVYAQASDGGIIWDPEPLPPDSTSYTWVGMDLSVTYDFYVVALGEPIDDGDPWTEDATTDSAPSDVVTLSTPQGPNRLYVWADSDSCLNLSWYDNSSDELGFEIERSSDGETFAPLTTVGADVTEYTDEGLSMGTGYYYRVREIGSEYWALPAGAQTLLATPTGLAATVIGPSQVELTWDDEPGGEDEFVILFSFTGGAWMSLGPVPGDTTSYVATRTGFGQLLQSGHTYYFAIARSLSDPVWGYNGSEQSEAVSVTMP